MLYINFIHPLSLLPLHNSPLLNPKIQFSIPNLNFELTLRSESRGCLLSLPSREEETPIHSA